MKNVLTLPVHEWVEGPGLGTRSPEHPYPLRRLFSKTRGGAFLVIFLFYFFQPQTAVIFFTVRGEKTRSVSKN